jgi:hypothetical protein
MPRPRLWGVSVQPLFTLLRLLHVPQTAVCQRLRVAKPTVSAWGTGTRPLPPRYHRQFFAFVAHKLDEALAREHARKAALARIEAAEGAEVLRKQFSPEEQEALRPEFEAGQDRIGLEVVVADVLSHSRVPDPPPPSLAEQLIQLLDKWRLETQHVELYREIWEQCRLVGEYGALDFDTFWQRVSSSPREREALQRAADMLVVRARRVDRIVAPLGAEQVFARREEWHALVAQTTGEDGAA